MLLRKRERSERASDEKAPVSGDSVDDRRGGGNPRRWGKPAGEKPAGSVGVTTAVRRNARRDGTCLVITVVFGGGEAKR